MRPLKIDEHSRRIKAAWEKLPLDQRARIMPVLETAHRAAIASLEGRIPPTDLTTVGNHFGLVHSVITDDRDGVVSGALSRFQGKPEKAVEVCVDAEGVIWGTGQYENLDPGWLEAGAVWLEHLILPKYAFNETIPEKNTPMPQRARIALAGDWGTGFCEGRTVPSARVNAAIENLKPDFTIHLGDVYYAGTEEYEQQNFATIWPKGAQGALALNSNHEMLPGGKPYFEALKAADSPFSVQDRRSFFALENDNWVVAGLDSAYYADEESLYSPGSLYEEEHQQVQMEFLKKQVDKGKKLIVLTHHNPLDLQDHGQEPYTFEVNDLGHQVLDGLPKNSVSYWYWGHVHAGAVYRPEALGGVLGRCCGHGGIPWAPCGWLGKPHGCSAFENKDYVEWWANTPDKDMPERLLNGFAVIDLDGPNITERFFDERGCLGFPAAPR